MKTLIIFLLLATPAMAQDYNSSPWNYKNAPNNWANSPWNYKNSPNNYDNSPLKYGNERIIRDNQGNATGYAVPKADGGVNYYDFSGKRQGYTPGQ